MNMPVDTVSCIQKDMAILREENRLLRIPAASQVIQVPRRAALMTTKVPRFDGTTSWEQYHQVFEAIVQSNGWDNDTAALQLFSHLEGDAQNVAHLVPLTRRLSRSGLVDYRRQFERTTRTVGEDPAIFATALETLAVKAFGDVRTRHMCNELGEVKGQDHTNNEQTQSVDDIYDLICSSFMGMHYNMIPVTTGDFTYTLHKYEVPPEYTKNTRSYIMT